jgi:hypothetical protein
MKKLAVPTEYQPAVLEAILVHYSQLRRAAINDTSKIAIAHLTDFDWKLLVLCPLSYGDRCVFLSPVYLSR